MHAATATLVIHYVQPSVQVISPTIYTGLDPFIVAHSPNTPSFLVIHDDDMILHSIQYYTLSGSK